MRALVLDLLGVNYRNCRKLNYRKAYYSTLNRGWKIGGLNILIEKRLTVKIGGLTEINTINSVDFDFNVIL